MKSSTELSNSFVGWLPNITGYLSFTLLGNAEYPSLAVTRRVFRGNKIYILSYQKRFLSDTTFPLAFDYLPLWLKERLDYLLGKESSFWFVFAAEYGDDKDSALSGVVTGKVFIFQRHEWKGIKRKINGISYKDNFDCGEFIVRDWQKSTHTSLEPAFDRLISKLENVTSVAIDVIFERNGYIQIEPVFIFEPAQSTKNKSTNLVEESNIKSAICAQAYYFIKDIIHSHYHHSPRTDSILDVFPSGSSKWRELVLNSLMRKVLALRRNREPDSLLNALGILAYAKTFKNVFLEKEIYVENIQLDHVEASLKVSLEAVARRSSSRASLFREALTFGFTIVAALIAFTGLLQVPGLKQVLDNDTQAHWIYSFLANDIFRNPIHLIYALLVPSFLGLYILSGLRILSPFRLFTVGEAKWQRSLTLLALGNRKRYMAAGYFIVPMGLLVCFLATWGLMRISNIW